MSDSSTRERLLGVSLTTMLLVAAVGGVVVTPAGAAGSADHDNEGSVSSSTSDIVAGATIGNVAGRMDNYTNAQIITDQNASKYVIEDNATGYRAYVNTSLEYLATDGTSGDVHLRANISHDEILDLEHAPGENVTIDSIAFNETNEDSAVNDTVQAYIEFDNKTATETITDADAQDTDLVTLMNDSGLVTVDTDATEVTMEDRSIPNDTYYIAAANGTVSDDLQSVVDAADSSPGVSNVWAPGPNAFALIQTDDMDSPTPVPVYTADNAPDDEDGWYVTIDEDVGGQSGTAIHIPDDVDADEMDVTFKAGDGVNAFAYLWQFDTLNLGDIIPSTIDFSGLTSGGVGMTVFGAGIAASAGRRRGGA